MATMEHVEKLREKANVSYAEAKAALDACGDDLLEALLYLERQGKVKPPEHGGYYSSKSEKEEKQGDTAENVRQSEPKGESFIELMGRFFRWVRDLFVKGCENLFDVQRGDNRIITMPVIVLVLLLIFCFWIVIPLMIIGLFLGCRYRFRGRDVEKTAVNKVMKSAENAAETLKTDIKEAADKNKERGE
ncbi:MAG: ubiquitin [Bacillota bacterium]